MSAVSGATVSTPSFERSLRREVAEDHAADLKPLRAIPDVGVAPPQGRGIEHGVREEQRRRAALGRAARRAQAEIRHPQELRLEVDVQPGTSARYIHGHVAADVALPRRGREIGETGGVASAQDLA